MSGDSGYVMLIVCVWGGGGVVLVLCGVVCGKGFEWCGGSVIVV